MIRLIRGDCLIEMQRIPDKSVDMILCDLPYGTTACKWDVVIPFDKLWVQYKRIIKDNGAIVLFGSEPFSSHLRMSNLKMYKYDWIWEKENGTNFFNSRCQPLKCHEVISVFSLKASSFSRNGKMNYFPIMSQGKPYAVDRSKGLHDFRATDKEILYKSTSSGDRLPRSTLRFNCQKGYHPTQKPVALLEYLIKTYTNKGDLILDNCMGSGSTMVACKNLGRHGIGIEKEEKYFNITFKRVLPEIYNNYFR